MTIRDLRILISRFDPDTKIEGPTLTVVRVKHNGALVLINDRHAKDLIQSATDYYEQPW